MDKQKKEGARNVEEQGSSGNDDEQQDRGKVGPQWQAARSIHSQVFPYSSGAKGERDFGIEKRLCRAQIWSRVACRDKVWRQGCGISDALWPWKPWM